MVCKSKITMNHANHISIISDGKKMFLPVINGFLNVRTFRMYFPRALGLKYQRNGVAIRILFENKDNVEVSTEIEFYEPYIAKGIMYNFL